MMNYNRVIIMIVSNTGVDPGFGKGVHRGSRYMEQGEKLQIFHIIQDYNFDVKWVYAQTFAF